MRLTPDRKTIQADGKDLCFITLEVLDKEGNPCPRAAIMQFVEVEGAGRLRALCNGDATDQTPFVSNYMKTFSGKMVAVVESSKTAGDIVIRTYGSRLKNGEATIHTVPAK